MAFLLNGTPVRTGAPFWREEPLRRLTFAYPAMAEKLNPEKAPTAAVGGAGRGEAGHFQDGGSELELAPRFLLNRLHI